MAYSSASLPQSSVVVRCGGLNMVWSSAINRRLRKSILERLPHSLKRYRARADQITTGGPLIIQIAPRYRYTLTTPDTSTSRITSNTRNTSNSDNKSINGERNGIKSNGKHSMSATSPDTQSINTPPALRKVATAD